MQARVLRPLIIALAALLPGAGLALAGSRVDTAPQLGDLPEIEPEHIIQFEVNSGSSTFNLWVREGSAAFIVDTENPDSEVIAFIPLITVGDVEEVEIFLAPGSTMASGATGYAQAERRPVRVGVGEAIYLSASGLVELVPLSIRTSPLGSTPRNLRQDSVWFEEVMDPSSQGLCCITSGGVSTCGCAVEQGGQSCCSPPCCSFLY